MTAIIKSIDLSAVLPATRLIITVNRDNMRCISAASVDLQQFFSIPSLQPQK